MNPKRLADYHRKLAALHAAIAAELAGEAAELAANDVAAVKPAKARGGRRGGVTVSVEKLRELGLSEMDMAAADREARRRGILRNNGGR